MKARIGIALGVYWSGIGQAIDVLAAISVLGAIGGLPTLIDVLSKYTRLAMKRLRGHETCS